MQAWGGNYNLKGRYLESSTNNRKSAARHRYNAYTRHSPVRGPEMCSQQKRNDAGSTAVLGIARFAPADALARTSAQSPIATGVAPVASPMIAVGLRLTAAAIRSATSGDMLLVGQTRTSIEGKMVWCVILTKTTR